MKKKRRNIRDIIGLIIIFVTFPTIIIAQQQEKRNLMRETNPEFFKSEEARRIGDQILLFQRNTGGWPKNQNMTRHMSDKELEMVLKDKARRDDSTIDNDATTMQMVYLARLYQQTNDNRYRDAFQKAVEFLLSGQYENGGWPQFWPEMHGYQPHITFNDDAIVNTLELFHEIIMQEAPYNGNLTDDSLRQRLSTAFDKGIDCILKTQIVVKGKPTVWCQQHDEKSLAPTSARDYELPSYCSQESASIVRLLMSLPNPSKEVKKAIHGAMKWFDTYKLTGLRYERGVIVNGVRTTRLVEDSLGAPLWARFYDLDRCEPYVSDRDGIPRRRLEQIGMERRNGYSWYNERPAELYSLYDAWAAKNDPKHKERISLRTKGANENGLIDMYRVPKAEHKDFNVVVRPGESIQAAIEQAPKTGTDPFKILVLKGTYNQHIDIDRPNIVLVGEERASTILELSEKDDVTYGEQKRHPMNGTVISFQTGADDCVISGFTISNNYTTAETPVEQPHWLPHRMTVQGSGTRTIIINCNILSTGNDALALWAKDSGGMYYHADLSIHCPGVDYLCPRGWCYATRCDFYGDSRAMIWHDGRGDKNKKLVITNSTFDAKNPTLLGRYHHDSQFYLIFCKMSKNIVNANIHYAYSDKVLDPCEWGLRTYYYGCTREGGHSGWLDNNLDKAENAPAFYEITAKWAFDGKWDPEKRIHDLWNVLAY